MEPVPWNLVWHYYFHSKRRHCRHDQFDADLWQGPFTWSARPLAINLMDFEIWFFCESDALFLKRKRIRTKWIAFDVEVQFEWSRDEEDTHFSWENIKGHNESKARPSWIVTLCKILSLNMIIILNKYSLVKNIYFLLTDKLNNRWMFFLYFLSLQDVGEHNYPKICLIALYNNMTLYCNLFYGIFNQTQYFPLRLFSPIF